MRKVTLIQFTCHNEQDFGYDPNLNVWYRAVDLDSEYDISGDDDEEYVHSITIVKNVRDRFGTTRRKNQHVLKDDDTEYNTIELELDDNSPLFI